METFHYLCHLYVLLSTEIGSVCRHKYSIYVANYKLHTKKSIFKNCSLFNLGINECKSVRNTHCVGPNLTCIDTEFSYRCGCKYSLKYVGGVCLSKLYNLTV